jgi:hypothetical protein
MRVAGTDNGQLESNAVTVPVRPVVSGLASPRRRLPATRLVGLAGAAWLLIATGARASDSPTHVIYPDPTFDVVARPTDAGMTAPYDPAQHRLIELHEIGLGRWAPLDPQADLFAGEMAAFGGFLRLDVVLSGLVNPPGSTDPMAFTPFRYGDHPIYGFIEIDMDVDRHTGGEVDAPQFRYLGNIARFGGLPEGDAFDDRLAEDASAFDGDFLTEPYVERSGEEFHLALLGDQFVPGGVAVAAGDGDQIFEAGERWVITGRWFHRAHGFEPFSVATGGAVPGEYAPECQLAFEHDPATDTTRLSLVFPLDNQAAASMRGESPEPSNHDPSDQASVREALHDLWVSADIVHMYPTGEPEEELILGWREHLPGSHLLPGDWRITALLGTTYTAAGHGFVWTDAYPNVIRGNVSGEHGLDEEDTHEVEEYISYCDADDGVVDGRVVLEEFAADFTVFDVNQDGVVGPMDLTLISVMGDCDFDGDVDLADFAVWQRCRGAEGGALDAGCAPGDLDSDGDLDLRDFDWFSHLLSGPGLGHDGAGSDGEEGL